MAIVTSTFIKSYFNITGTSLDARIATLIPIVEDDYLTIRNKAFETDDEGAIVYPDNSETVAAEMVMYKIQSMQKVSVDSDGNISSDKEAKSESWGDHSISYGDSLVFSQELKFNYPKNIVNRIVRYAGFTEA